MDNSRLKSEEKVIIGLHTCWQDLTKLTAIVGQDTSGLCGMALVLSSHEISVQVGGLTRLIRTLDKLQAKAAFTQAGVPAGKSTLSVCTGSQQAHRHCSLWRCFRKVLCISYSATIFPRNSVRQGLLDSAEDTASHPAVLAKAGQPGILNRFSKISFHNCT